MKLLHLADVHLGARYSAFGERAAGRSNEVLNAFRRIPDVAAVEEVSAVLVAGDLFDGPRPPRAVLAAVRDTLRRLLERGVSLCMVPGNHDSTTLRDHPYRELARGSGITRRRSDRAFETAREARAYVLDSPRFDAVRLDTRDGPLHVYGLAYDPAECDAPLATFRRTAGPGVHVLLLHASVHSADHWSGSGSSLRLRPEELAPVEVDYMALGDHHRPTLLGELPGVPACYPGSFAACDLTEAGPRGYLLVSVAPGAPPRVEHRDAGAAPVVHSTLDVSSVRDDVEAADRAAAELPPGCVPVIRLVGEPAYPLDPQGVLAELLERFGHAQVSDETRYYASHRLDELAELDTVAGHVVRLGRARIEAAGRDHDRAVARRALRVALRALGVDG